jgi:peptidoglycan-associated lipoprotein
MKRSLFINLLLVTALVVGGAVGCKRKPKSPTPIPANAGGMGTGSGFGPKDVDTGRVVEPIAPVELGGGELQGGAGDGGLDPLVGGMENWNADRGFFSLNTVHFDFDRSTIRSEDIGKVEAVGQHLKANPNQGVRVEGHCDERGTEGYNLALGERRALAVREYLLNMGVADNRVDTVSFGESQPVDFGNSEAAYRANRRGEFLLLTP